ncbi:MAG: hypothetical protein RIC52_06530 [Amphiplicatus sp.]
MNEFELLPGEGATGIRFGDDRADVRREFGADPESAKRTPDSVTQYDYYCELNFFVYYDADYLVEAVEFAQGASLNYSGMNILEASATVLRQFLQKKMIPFVETPDSLLAESLSLCAWYPDKEDEPQRGPASVLVFRKGYHDQRQA